MQRRRAANDGRDTSALDDEFYRKLAEIRGVPHSAPTSAQLRCQSVTGALRHLRQRGQMAGPSASTGRLNWREGMSDQQNREHNTLVEEYSTLFNAVSWDPQLMPDPERQRVEDLALDR